MYRSLSAAAVLALSVVYRENIASGFRSDRWKIDIDRHRYGDKGRWQWRCRVPIAIDRSQGQVISIAIDRPYVDIQGWPQGISSRGSNSISRPQQEAEISGLETGQVRRLLSLRFISFNRILYVVRCRPPHTFQYC